MSYWSQPLRVESTEYVQLITVRCINSRLWLLNNSQLENCILATLAKYQAKHKVEILAFVIQGNHLHILLKCTRPNRAAFMRDFNARLAEAVRRYQPQFLGGPLLERRYTSQFVSEEKVKDMFFYCALQAMQSGLAERFSDYSGYNSVFDAIKGKVRTYSLMNWTKYHAKKRVDSKARKKDFLEYYELKFSLPTELGDERTLLEELEKRRSEDVARWKAKGHRFPGKELRKVIPGSLSYNSKKGDMRPIVLAATKQAREVILSWYFSIVSLYREASIRLCSGDPNANFPPMTYPPPTGLVT